MPLLCATIPCTAYSLVLLHSERSLLEFAVFWALWHFRAIFRGFCFSSTHRTLFSIFTGNSQHVLDGKDESSSLECALSFSAPVGCGIALKLSQEHFQDERGWCEWGLSLARSTLWRLAYEYAVLNSVPWLRIAGWDRSLPGSGKGLVFSQSFCY